MTPALKRDPRGGNGKRIQHRADLHAANSIGKLYSSHRLKQNHLQDTQTAGSPRDRCGGRNQLGRWDSHIHYNMYKIDNQPGPTVQQREINSTLCYALYENSIHKIRHVCICITVSGCWTPKTNTT